MKTLEIIAQQHRFWASIARLLQQTNSSRGQMFSNKKGVGYLLLLIIVIIIIGAIGYNLFNTPGIAKRQVNLTAENVHVVYGCVQEACKEYYGDYLGPTLQKGIGGRYPLSLAVGSQFIETVTPRNQDCCTSHQVTSASSLTPGFTLISMTPNLPITLHPGDNISIILNIQAPKSAYSGTLDIQITSSS